MKWLMYFHDHKKLDVNCAQVKQYLVEYSEMLLQHALLNSENLLEWNSATNEH
jgi:hypothetical protein